MNIRCFCVGIVVAVAIAAGGRTALAADSKAIVGEVSKIQPGQADGVLMRALNVVADIVPWLTDDVTGKVIENKQQQFEAVANTSINQLKKTLKGQSFKGETARAIKATAESRSVFLSALGTVLNVVDVGGTAFSAAGYVAEGDLIGAFNMTVDSLLKKGAGMAGAFAGGAATGGPWGSVAGVIAAQAVYEATGGAMIEKADDATRMQLKKAEFWGPKMGDWLFSGPFKASGGTYGKVRVALRPGRTLTCTVSGKHMGGDIAATGSGTLRDDRSFEIPVAGSVTFQGPKATTKEAFSGKVTGTLDYSQASGNFTTTGAGKTVSGTWEAPRM